MEHKSKVNSLFGEIESKEMAIKIIKHLSEIFVVIGSLQIILSFIINNFPFESKVAIGITGLIYLCLGLLLGKYKKTILAIMLLILSLTGVIITSMNLFGILGTNQNKGLPIMGIAIAIACVKAIKATRKYNEKK